VERGWTRWAARIKPATVENRPLPGTYDDDDDDDDDDDSYVDSDSFTIAGPQLWNNGCALFFKSRSLRAKPSTF